MSALPARSDAGVSAFDRGRFDLPLPQSRLLMARQARWAIAQGAVAALLPLVGLPATLAAGLAAGAGLAAAATLPAHLLPLQVIGTVAGTALLAELGMPAPVAAAAAAGFLAASPFLLRMEGALAGGAAVGLAAWATQAVGAPGPATAVLGAALIALAGAQALLPSHLRFTPVARVPSPLQISRNLEPAYRAAPMRAWQIDGDLARGLGEVSQDEHTREGLAEVGAWVYRLALTLQTLDHDILRIDPDATQKRREELLEKASATTDSFLQDRHRGTAAHLERLLDHRSAMVRERERIASLQDYALAYLEEARAGIAMARILPGERSPEQLGVVLDKLRSHAAAGDARRRATHELERIGQV